MFPGKRVNNIFQGAGFTPTSGAASARLERTMLKALDELEKAIFDLLDRFQAKAGFNSGSTQDRPADLDGNVEEREQEAAELIRRAIARLKSL